MEIKRGAAERITTLPRRQTQMKGVICLLACASLCISVVITEKMPPPEDLPALPSATPSSGDSSEGGAASGDGSFVNLSIQNGMQTLELTTREGDVSDALKQADIELGEFDEMNCGLHDKIYNGMEIVITRVTVTVFEEYESIPFETVRKANAKLTVGTSKVTRKGVNGRSKNSYDVVYRNGAESDRIFLASVTVDAPVDKIIEYGTSIPDKKSGGPYTLDLPNGSTITYKTAIRVVATAYSCENQEDRITATGTIARVGEIAVDPKLIPLGSRLYVMAEDGSWSYGYAVAEDTGGFIKGYRIDLYYDTVAQCIAFGRKKAMVYILD